MNQTIKLKMAGCESKPSCWFPPLSMPQSWLCSCLDFSQWCTIVPGSPSQRSSILTLGFLHWLPYVGVLLNTRMYKINIYLSIYHLSMNHPYIHIYFTYFYIYFTYILHIFTYLQKGDLLEWFTYCDLDNPKVIGCGAEVQEFSKLNPWEWMTQLVFSICWNSKEVVSNSNE